MSPLLFVAAFCGTKRPLLFGVGVSVSGGCKGLLFEREEELFSRLNTSSFPSFYSLASATFRVVKLVHSKP